MTITTIIFDVDDTLYDVSTGFTAYRNGGAAQQFMVDRLDFPDLASAKALRDEYFERYHATAKALTMAEKEGRFPPPKDPEKAQYPRFKTADLAEYWAANLKFDLLEPKKKFLQDLIDCPLQLVAFSNGPRKYVQRVLLELGLKEIFGKDRLFAVDDVLPSCKPEKEAFEVVFSRIGAKAEQCIMVEDSMKNIRCAKKLGMKTVLVAGKGRLSGISSAAAEASEATKPGDSPDQHDPAVDVAVETVEELREKMPELWTTR